MKFHPSFLSRWRAWLVLSLTGWLALTSQAGPSMANASPVAATPRSSLVRVADGRLLAPDIARIVERGELVVAMLATDTPPFFYQKNGEMVGLEVDMARDLARELNVKLRITRQARTFNEVVDVIAQQDADLGISKLSRTLSRAQTVRFSDPYLHLRHALVLNRLQFARLARDQPIPSVVRKFNGSIGVIANSAFANFAVRNFPNAQIRPYASWGEVVAAVRNGEVASAYRDEFEIKRLLTSDPTASLTLRTVTFKDLNDTLGIAVSVADPVLLAFVNQYLHERSDKLDIEKVLQATIP